MNRMERGGTRRDDVALAEMLAALAGPTRLRILRLLQARAVRCRRPACELTAHCCNVTELASALGTSVPNVSHHLRELRRAGLIRMERRGRFVEVSLDASALAGLAAVFAEFARHGSTPLEVRHARDRR